MAKIRGKDTVPEIIVRKRLFAAGWRFRVCDKRFNWRGYAFRTLPFGRGVSRVS
ncbi:MAG: hypothetical protein IKJ45_18135 [Kiritimatiellae bacterium]|nr:hypothetical protein [Kiritimatiellia bacterium]